MESSSEKKSHQRQPSSAPTLSPILALACALLYTRFVMVFLVGPVVVVVSPLVMVTSGWITSSQNGLLDMLVAFGFYQGIARVIRNLTPNQEHFEDVMEKMFLRYMFQSMALSFLVVRFLISPIIAIMGISLALNWHLMSVVRFAVMVSILQVTVLARYIGPQSIMRCSSFPLVSNPLTSCLRVMLRKSIMFLFQSPNPKIVKPHSSEEFNATRRGRRLRHPTSLATFAQILMAVFAGFAICRIYLQQDLLLESHFDLGDDDSFRSFLMISCVFSMLLPLALFVQGDEHELDPTQYMTTTSNSNNMAWSRIIMLKIQQSFIASLFSVALAFVTVFLAFEQSPAIPVRKILLELVSLGLLTLWGSLYDLVLRYALFLESPFDKDVDIAVVCLIESKAITDNLLCGGEFSNTKNTGSIDFQELCRVNSLSKDMGVYMTSRVENEIEYPLEQDILRFQILNAYGGGGIDGSSLVGRPSRVPKQQERHILKLVAAKYADSSSYGDHRTKILVRGLCVFAGGLGEAFVIVSEKRKFRYTEEKWTIPPGCLVEMQFMIRAIIRIFGTVHTCASPAAAAQLAVLVPAVLSAMFRLRTGVETVRKKGAENSQIQVDSMLSSRLEDIVKQCDRAAAFIFSLHSTTPQQIPLLPLDKLAIEWLQRCVSDTK